MARISSLAAASAVGATCCLIAWSTAVTCAKADALPRGDEPPLEMRQDAELADVYFLDERRGWAVGDRGAIWHTADGGNRWHLQRSGVDCRLESVHFVDADNGWAAGGWDNPYTHVSRGVLLRTADGGATWEPENVVLPRILQVRMFGRQGWIVTRPAALFPSGLLTTDDAGRTFNAIPHADNDGWVAAHVSHSHGGPAGRAPGTVRLIDAQGRAAVAQAGQIDVVPRPAVRETARRMTFVDGDPRHPGGQTQGQQSQGGQSQGWLVGDNGLIRVSDDGGRTWHDGGGRLPAETAEQFDFHAVAVLGSNVWIAGSPGTFVLHSADAGRTWSMHPTGQIAPLRAMTSIDRHRGRAVGSLGAILHTRDGGRTWRRQQGGGTRAALLGIFHQPADVPLELFAQLCGNDGYLGTVQIYQGLGDPSDPFDPSDRRAAGPQAGRLNLRNLGAEQRTHDALVAVGASGAMTSLLPEAQAGRDSVSPDSMPTPPPSSEAQRFAALEKRLVRQIRTWRPNVVVTHPPSPDGRRPLDHWLNQGVLRAVEKAADHQAYPDQLNRGGLQPWRVTKVFASLPAEESGTLDVTTARLAPRLGRSLSDQASRVRGLLVAHYEPPPRTLGFRLLMDRTPNTTGRRDFFSGIPDEAMSTARRAAGAYSSEPLDALKRAAAAQRNAHAILQQAEHPDVVGGGLLAQIDALTRSLDEQNATEIMYRLGQGYHRAGRWDLAAEVFERIVERHPRQPLAQPALVWLMRYAASGEAAWRFRHVQRFPVRQASVEMPAGGPDQRQSPGHGPGRDQPPGNASATPLDRITALVSLAERHYPLLVAEPEIRFPHVAALRQAGRTADAQQRMRSMVATRPHDAWRESAQGELWLADRRGRSPVPTWICARAANRPYLDGKFDDETWRSAEPLRIGSPSPIVEARAAYDDEFLYVAIECRKLPDVDYEHAPGPRQRDADLSERDRVALRIDVDRDFATAYRFVVDHRGWGSDDLWEDRTWDARWFIAADQAEGWWRVELAIPLAELTAETPAPGDAWAVSLRRVGPSGGDWSWTGERHTEVGPASFGYLLFE